MKEDETIGLQVFEAIKNDILFAKLSSGTQLRVRVLTEQYGCGGSPVREALNKLNSMGWVERVDRRGFFVSATSNSNFEDILFNRCHLEAEALRKSIEYGDEEWEENIVLTHFKMSKVPRFDNQDNAALNRDWEEAHKAFHMSLLSACRSPILTEMCEKLYDQNIRYRFEARKHSRGERKVSIEHNSIKNLVLSRQVEPSIAALQAHYMSTSAFMLEELKQKDRRQSSA